jgi:hypothetical protein
MTEKSEYRDLFPGAALEMMILQTLIRKAMHGYASAQHIKNVSDDLVQIEEAHSRVLFWELSGVNLCSLFGVKLGHAGAGGVVGRDSGYCVITLPAA